MPKRLKETMIRSDFHMHTAFSTDSEEAVESMLNRAVERGLYSVCITDHMDADYPPDDELGESAFRLDTENYFPFLLKKKIKCFDVLGHLDYVVRYGKHQAEAYSYEKFSDEIDMILRELISSGKGLELNMAGIKYGLGFAHPHPSVLRRYKELGGEIITVGSDAHKAEHIGYEFEIAGELLKSCGFRYYTEFENRKAVFRRIP